MVSINPFGDFQRDCETALRKAFTEIYPGISVESFLLGVPLTPEFGELASSICFELAKKLDKKPREIADQIVENINIESFPIIKNVKAAGKGYINFYSDFAELSALVIQSIRILNNEYGYVKTDKPQKVIVEHTSVNPIHPITIGQARNPVLGDALARILKARGHTVARHYYVDDVGRQTAIAAFAYDKLGEPKPEEKPDHFVGNIYTVASCIIEINRLKKEAEKTREKTTDEDARELQRKLDDWIIISKELKNRFPQIFDKLLKETIKDENLEQTVSSLNRAYEAGEEKAKHLVRKVCKMCLEGFKQTLSRAEIFYDSWDWESDFVWNNEVAKNLDKLKKTPYVFQEGGVMEFNAEKVAKNLKLKEILGIKKDYEIPSLTLNRSDGTTLYTTRDIPYNLWKFKKAEKVINVIGMEQKLPQQQLKLALWALGHANQAKNLTHFAYNLITLPDYKMSSRRGRYITLDEVMDEAIKRAREEVEKRSPQLADEEKLKISKIVGIGALKYALVEVDPVKPVVFTWDRVIDFERNSAPYIQYSYARALSILRKAKREPEKPDYSLLEEPIEHNLVLALARFPEVFVNSAENLKPNAIADYANILADKFNSFYNALPVLKAKPKTLSDARLALVEAISIVLRNSLNLIGIIAPEKM